MIPQQIIKEQKAEIERLKGLLTRAVDALVNENHVWFNEGDELVQELRKAAQ